MSSATLLKMPVPAKSKRAPRRREHGEGRVYLRGKTWWIQYYVDGEQVRESSRSELKTAALDMLQDRLVAARAGQLTPLKVPYTLMRDLLYKVFEQQKHKSLLTRKDGTKYIGPVPALDRFFEKKSVQEITTALCRKFIEERQAAGVSNDGINGSLRVLRRMFSLLVKEKGYPVTKVPHIPFLPKNKPRKDFLTQEQFTTVHAKLPKELQPLFECSYYTGARKSELLKLHWSKVDFKNGVLLFEDTKNGEDREVPMVGPVAETLRELRTKHLTDELVFTRNGEPIKDYRRAWRNALAACGLKAGRKDGGHTWHGNRRSAAVNLMAAGVDEQTAMSITGHHDADTFRKHYRVLLREAKLAAAAKLAGHLGIKNTVGQNGDNSGDKRNATKGRKR